MAISHFIARRYLFSKNGRNAINLINILSFIITLVGTAALLIVLSGFSGLKVFSLQFTNYFDPDLKVLPKSGKTIVLNTVQQQQLDSMPEVVAYAPIIEEKVFLNVNQKNSIARLKGVPINYPEIVSPDSILLYGNWLSDNRMQVVVGAGIAYDLGLGVSDYSKLLSVMVPRPGTEAINALNMNRAFNKSQVVLNGVYCISESLDKTYIFSTSEMARDLLEYPQNVVSAIEIRKQTEASEGVLRKKLHDILGNNIEIKNRLQLNEGLYKMLNSEHLAVYLVLTLILIIALFNTVGSIIMMILDKRENLLTLKSLGMSTDQLRRIFMLQGIAMTALGGLSGIILAGIFVYGQIKNDWLYIAPGLPYPFELTLQNILLSFMTVLVLGGVASYLGSRRISDKLLTS